MTNKSLTRANASQARRHSSAAPAWVKPLAIGSLLAGAALAVATSMNRRLAKDAERAHPPKGRFLHVQGVRLHYVERGSGEPVVLLHGNGASSDELLSSGLVDILAKKYRVIVIDRPGYGFSTRPGDTIWTAERQAGLVYLALEKLNAKPALVFGHSWGTLVALALAQRHPNAVRALTLASGYFFPTPRIDALAMSAPALPVVGAVAAATISPLAGRIMWRALIRKMFAPAPTPAKFNGYPKELALRPSQLRASAGDSALMVPAANALQGRYEHLRMPISIIAGDSDKIVSIEKQSAQLHELLPHSHFVRLPGVGHMTHQTDPHAVAAAIDWAAGQVALEPNTNATQGEMADRAYALHKQGAAS